MYNFFIFLIISYLKICYFFIYLLGGHAETTIGISFQELNHPLVVELLNIFLVLFFLIGFKF